MTKEYIITANDIKESLDKGFDKGYKQGLTTHVKSIDKHFRWMRGNVIVFYGIPGNGKSTMLNQLLMLRALKDGDRFVYYTPEFSPTDFFFLDLMHTYKGKSPHFNHKINKMTKEEFADAREFVSKHFFFIMPDKRGDSPQGLNEKFERAFGEFGAKTFITDPFNKLQHAWQSQGGRDDRYLGEFLDLELRFAQDHNVSKVVVMHTNGTVSTDDDGNFKCPHYFQIAGGAMTANRVDDIVAIHKPYAESDKSDTTILFSSKKIKKQAVCGVPGDVYLYFDRLRNRIIDKQGEGEDLSLKDPFKGYKNYVDYMQTSEGYSDLPF